MKGSSVLYECVYVRACKDVDCRCRMRCVRTSENKHEDAPMNAKIKTRRDVVNGREWYGSSNG